MVNPPRAHLPYDLMAIAGVTALLAICIVFVPWDILRIVLGVPLIMFFPGYAILAALFPRRDSLSGVERVSISVVLSLSVVPLVGLLLNSLWEISLYPVLASIAAVTLIMCVAAFFRRSRLAPQDQYQPRIALQMPSPGPLKRQDRILAAILLPLAVVAFAALVWVAAHPTTPQRLTEFYLLGSSQTAQYYPQEVVLGAQAPVTVGIVNREGEDVTYRVRVLLDSSEVQVMDALALGDGAMWEDTVTLMPTAAGENQQVEFLLYRADESEPYRTLHLWIDVRDPSAPPSTP